jgi:hypothetical protein
MKPYTFALAANQIMDASLGGEYFLLDVAPSPVKFEFFGAGNLRREETLEDALPGDWATPEKGFAGIKITNGAVPQSVRFYVARGRVGRFRVSVSGGINLDPEDARYFLFGDDEVIDNEAFSAGNTGGPSAGLVTVHQLFNPGGSGKVLYLDKILMTAGTATTRVHARQHNAALGALTAQGVGKNLGGAAGAGAYRQGTASAGTNIEDYLLLLNGFSVIDVKPAWRIAPGFGFHIEDVTVNQVLVCAFHWREKLT